MLKEISQRQEFDPGSSRVQRPLRRRQQFYLPVAAVVLDVVLGSDRVAFRWSPASEAGAHVFGISFLDIGEEDSAVLRPSFGTADECIFSGFLQNEPDVLVSVNGCPHSDEADVSSLRATTSQQKTNVR